MENTRELDLMVSFDDVIMIDLKASSAEFQPIDSGFNVLILQVKYVIFPVIWNCTI